MKQKIWKNSNGEERIEYQNRVMDSQFIEHNFRDFQNYAGEESYTNPEMSLYFSGLVLYGPSICLLSGQNQKFLLHSNKILKIN